MPDLFKTFNPALNANIFENRFPIAGRVLPLQGTVNRTGGEAVHDLGDLIERVFELLRSCL